MAFWKWSQRSTLTDYYRTLAVIWPVCLLPMFVAVHLLIHISASHLLIPYLICSGCFILGGAPLLYWAHQSSLRTGNPRPIIAAVNLMLLFGIGSFMYLVFEYQGFDLFPAFGALLVLVAPLALLYWHPAARVWDDPCEHCGRDHQSKRRVENRIRYRSSKLNMQ